MAGLQEYKCPCCGGAVAFDSGLQKLKCPFCDTEFELDDLKTFDEEVKNEGTDNFTWNTTPGSEWTEAEASQIQSFVCKSCGGEIVGDMNMAATACPYCGNPVVVSGQFSGMLKPDYVIPFKLDKAAAMERLKKHMSGKKLLPPAFKDAHHIEEVKGVYVPFWLFDADVDAHIRYKASERHTWQDDRYKYEETKYFCVVREGKIAFDKVPVDGSSKIDDTLMESLEPFNFKEAKDFNTAYLAGYVADKYDVDAGTSIGRANERIRRATERAFRRTVKGYDSVDVETSTIRLDNAEAKYALYPVWLLNTTWNGSKYVFAMNGQTGKFVGNLPMDKGLFWKYFFRTAGIFTVAAFAVQMILFYVM